MSPPPGPSSFARSNSNVAIPVFGSSGLPLLVVAVPRLLVPSSASSAVGYSAMLTPPTGKEVLPPACRTAPAWIVCFVIRKGRSRSTSFAAGTSIPRLSALPENA